MTDIEPRKLTIAAVWSHPKRDLWICTRNGDYAGMVELNSEHFDAFDGTGRPCGTHPDLRCAQQALLTRSDPNEGTE
ncbi:hypothetical protein [Leifsonia poae]|uniref:hypothetical protein n=1 Tax=Leifsonia poae TaxID=110933 RepID=UPI003D665853